MNIYFVYIALTTQINTNRFEKVMLGNTPADRYKCKRYTIIDNKVNKRYNPKESDHSKESEKMNLSMCMISIKVNNIEKAKHFYCELLGFQFEKAYGNQLVELNIDGLPIILEEVSNQNILDYYDHSQIILGLKTKDLITEMKNLKEKGIELLFEEPQIFPPGIFNVMKDPFGNYIEILEFR